VEPGHAVRARGVEDDRLVAEDRAGGHQGVGPGLLQQHANHMQRIGQHLHVQAIEVGAHVQGRRAAPDHHRLAGPAERRRRLADGPLLQDVADAAVVQRRAVELWLAATEALARQARPAAHSRQPPLAR
jgi:hypothetical protein